MAERGAVPAEGAGVPTGHDDVPTELRARMDAAAPVAIDERALAIAARERLDAVLDLVAEGRAVREAGTGLNPASSQLLVADAFLTDAMARAAANGTFDDVLPLLELERLTARARELDGRA
ncbi:MAG TPA: hypothetical protein VF039_14890 [Longimicrobiales bacterium]